MGREKNVFISHYSKDDEHVQRLKSRLLDQGFKLKNSSIDSTKRNRQNRIINGEAIKRLLRLRIRWAGTFICLIGKETHTRPWVDFEIEQAHKVGKKIIGVYTHGAKTDAPLPANFIKYGGERFGWNSTEKIIDSIANNTPYEWESPNGTVSYPTHSLQTVKC